MDRALVYTTSVHGNVSDWEISPTLFAFMTEHRLYIHFAGVRIDDRVIQRYTERLTFLRDATYFVKLPPSAKINWVNHWLWQQGVDRPWFHRLRVLQAQRNEEQIMCSIYGFLPGQDALAVHFKMRWS